MLAEASKEMAYNNGDLRASAARSPARLSAVIDGGDVVMRRGDLSASIGEIRNKDAAGDVAAPYFRRFEKLAV